MTALERKHKVVLRNRNNLTLEVGENESIIDAFETTGSILPVACRYGGCITCAAKIVSGSVRQPNATALNKRQSKSGYVLLCVARPTEDCVLDVGVESHNSLYQNPFANAAAVALFERALARSKAP